MSDTPPISFSLPVPQLIQQAVYIPEEDVYLQSTHQHDYVTHEWVGKDGIKHSYSIDGGTAYVRRASDDFTWASQHVKDWSLHDNSPFDLIATRLLWGTCGKDGTEPLRRRPIASFTLPHLRAILKTQPQIIGTVVERVVGYWVKEKSGTGAKGRKRT